MVRCEVGTGPIRTDGPPRSGANPAGSPRANSTSRAATSRAPSHKGVGILRPDGEAQAGGEARALTVRNLREDVVVTAINGWLGQLFDRENQAQVERAAAQAEFDNMPARTTIIDAEVYAMVDSLGDVGAVMADAKPTGLARLYRELNLELRYEPDEQAVYATARPRADSACARGRLAHQPHDSRCSDRATRHTGQITLQPSGQVVAILDRLLTV